MNHVDDCFIDVLNYDGLACLWQASLTSSISFGPGMTASCLPSLGGNEQTPFVHFLLASGRSIPVVRLLWEQIDRVRFPAARQLRVSSFLKDEDTKEIFVW